MPLTLPLECMACQRAIMRRTIRGAWVCPECGTMFEDTRDSVAGAGAFVPTLPPTRTPSAAEEGMRLLARLAVVAALSSVGVYGVVWAIVRFRNWVQ